MLSWIQAQHREWQSFFVLFRTITGWELWQEIQLCQSWYFLRIRDAVHPPCVLYIGQDGNKDNGVFCGFTFYARANLVLTSLLGKSVSLTAVRLTLTFVDSLETEKQKELSSPPTHPPPRFLYFHIFASLLFSVFSIIHNFYISRALLKICLLCSNILSAFQLDTYKIFCHILKLLVFSLFQVIYWKWDIWYVPYNMEWISNRWCSLRLWIAEVFLLVGVFFLPCLSRSNLLAFETLEF